MTAFASLEFEFGPEVVLSEFDCLDAGQRLLRKRKSGRHVMLSPLNAIVLADYEATM